MSKENYLKLELYDLIKKDSKIFDFLQEGALDGLWYWDLENPENEWMNARFWQLLGIDPATKTHQAHEWQDLINADDLETALENFQKHVEDASHPYDQIVRYRHADGSTVWVRCRGLAIRDTNGKPIRMLGAHNDVTELKEAEIRLEELSNHDDLTGLHNRRSFEQHFDWAVKNALRSGMPVSLLYLDIDYFKAVNDAFGHAAGDRLLVSVANLLTRNCRSNDFACRYGGEEFLVVLHNTDEIDALNLAERLRAEVANIEFEKPVTASVGLATMIIKEPGNVVLSVDALKAHMIETADAALYQAKDTGRNKTVGGSIIQDKDVR